MFIHHVVLSPICIRRSGKGNTILVSLRRLFEEYQLCMRARNSVIGLASVKRGTAHAHVHSGIYSTGDIQTSERVKSTCLQYFTEQTTSRMIHLGGK